VLKMAPAEGRTKNGFRNRVSIVCDVCEVLTMQFLRRRFYKSAFRIAFFLWSRIFVMI
jgi:hypothetical protein